ncbi:hypothetical protein BTJ49_11185 [Oleiagrimonas sp. MCCC 1A03011]|nr:hypothetical protein BTJ49_11185 [Oleiagrimonas sp. MCCC 1A03011]
MLYRTQHPPGPSYDRQRVLPPELRAMTRWILLLLTLASILLMILTSSPGWMALGIAGALFGLVATVLAFAHVRIGAGSRQEELNDFEVEQLQKAVRKPDAGEPPSA